MFFLGNIAQKFFFSPLHFQRAVIRVNSRMWQQKTMQKTIHELPSFFFLLIYESVNCSVLLHMSLWALLYVVGSFSLLMKMFRKKLNGHLLEMFERGFKHQMLGWVRLPSQPAPIWSPRRERANKLQQSDPFCKGMLVYKSVCHPCPRKFEGKLILTCISMWNSFHSFLFLFTD